MPTNVCYELFSEIDEDLTCTTTAAVVGKRFVAISADLASALDITSTALPTTWDSGNFRVAQCGAGVKAIGVAAYDQASGATVPVKAGGKIVPVTSGAAITAGAEVESNAAGKAITLATGKACGQAYSTVAGADLDVYVRLYP